jgi:hypothetical protein
MRPTIPAAMITAGSGSFLNRLKTNQVASGQDGREVDESAPAEHEKGAGDRSGLGRGDPRKGSIIPVGVT